MELTEVVALRAYAKMLNTLSVEPLESILADYFVYESQTVFQALESKQTFLEHIIPKLQTIHRSNATVYAEMGTVTAYGKSRPCKSGSGLDSCQSKGSWSIFIKPNEKYQPQPL